MKRLILFVFILTVLFTGVNFAKKVGEIPDLMKPIYLLVDGDNLVFVQGYTVYVYSATTHKLKHSFIKKGQGPQEIWQERPRIQWADGNIVAHIYGKMLFYTQDGKYIKEFMTPKDYSEMIPLKNNRYVIGKRFTNREKREVSMKFYITDDKFKIIKEIYSAVYDINVAWGGRGSRFANFKMIPHSLELSTVDDKIIIADTQKGFFLNVYDSDGNLLNTIDNNSAVKPVSVSDDYKARSVADFKVTYKRMWKFIETTHTFSKEFPAFMTHISADGKIYVITYLEKDGMHELITLDLKGKILKRQFVPLKSIADYKRPGGFDTPLSIKDGKLYELVENVEEESYELHVTDLN